MSSQYRRPWLVVTVGRDACPQCDIGKPSEGGRVQDVQIVTLGRDTIEVVAVVRDDEGEAATRVVANLMAAAPELLEALGDLLRVIATDQLIPESVSYMMAARQAVAKAEGRA